LEIAVSPTFKEDSKGIFGLLIMGCIYSIKSNESLMLNPFDK
jgi:hypothetical protein